MTAAAASPVRVGDLSVNRLGFGAMRVCGPNLFHVAAGTLKLSAADLASLE